MVSESKTKKKTNQSIKQELLNSFKENDDLEEQPLSKTANNISNKTNRVY